MADERGCEGIAFCTSQYCAYQIEHATSQERSYNLSCEADMVLVAMYHVEERLHCVSPKYIVADIASQRPFCVSMLIVKDSRYYMVR